MSSVWDVHGPEFDDYVGTFSSKEEAERIVREYNALQPDADEAYVEERELDDPYHYLPSLHHSKTVYVRRDASTRVHEHTYRSWKPQKTDVKVHHHRQYGQDLWQRNDDTMFTIMATGWDKQELDEEVARQIQKCIDLVNRIKERQ